MNKKELEDNLYKLTLQFRHRDVREKEGPPSQYMPDYAKAAKEVYCLARNLAQTSGSDPWDWVSIITERCGSWRGPLDPLSHYHNFMLEVNFWLVEHRLSIGELAYHLSRGALFRFFRQGRIRELKIKVEESRLKLRDIYNKYGMTFKSMKGTYEQES